MDETAPGSGLEEYCTYAIFGGCLANPSPLFTGTYNILELTFPIVIVGSKGGIVSLMKSTYSTSNLYKN